jgi:hypothetical protein
VVVAPFTSPLSVHEDRARIAAVLDMLIAVTTLCSGAEWSHGQPQPRPAQEQRAAVSPRNDAIARARAGWAE